MSVSKPTPPTEVGPNPFIRQGVSNWQTVPGANGAEQQHFAFPPDAAAYTYTGMRPADLALPSMDWATGIHGVLKRVHPDTGLNMDGLLVMEDLVTVSRSPPHPLLNL